MKNKRKEISVKLNLKLSMPDNWNEQDCITFIRAGLAEGLKEKLTSIKNPVDILTIKYEG